MPTGWSSVSITDPVTNKPSKLTECPREFVTHDVWELLAAVDCCKQGLPPVHGGYLDQTACFVAAYRFVLNEQDRVKADG